MSPYRQAFYEKYLSHRVEGEEPFYQDQCVRQSRYLARLLKDYLPPDKSTPCLDLGCGGGNFLYFLRAQGYFNILGVDLSPEQAFLAEKLGFQVIQSDVFAFFKSSEKIYGLISALDMLEHLHKEEIVELLGLIRNHLQPGGIFLGRTPNGGSPLGGFVCYGDFTHETVLTPTSVYQILRQAGFSDIRLFEQRPLLLGLVSGVRSALWSVIRLLYKFLAGAEAGGFGPEILSQVFWWVARR